MNLNLFENPTMGILLALVVEIVAIWLYNASEWRWRKPFLAAGFIMLGLFLALDILVETNREQLTRISREVVRAAEQEQPRTIAFHLGNDLLIGGKFDRHDTVAVINDWLSGPIIESNMITRLEVVDDRPASARVELSVITQFDGNGRLGAAGILKSRWRLDFRRAGEEPFKLVDLTNTSLNDGPGINWMTFRIP